MGLRERSEPRVLTSYSVTLVTVPTLSASSLTSSLRSNARPGSSSNSFTVNMCFNTTTLAYLELTWAASAAGARGSSSSSDDQSSSLLDDRKRLDVVHSRQGVEGPD